MFRPHALHVLRPACGLAMAICALGLPRIAPAQTVDPTFVPDFNWAAGQYIRRILPAPGGGYYLLLKDDIQRVSAQGLRDSGFSVNADDDIDDMVVQADGKILIVGNFNAISNIARPSVARLNTDGSLDASFVPQLLSGSTYNGRIFLRADGSILASSGSGGDFQLPSSVHTTVVRLKASGALDEVFQLDSNLTNQNAAVQLPDMRILWHGEHWDDGGHTSSSDWAGVLSANGSIGQRIPDLESLDGPVINVSAVEPDGRILVKGLMPTSPTFSVFNYFGKLDSNLGIDYSFQPSGLRTFSALYDFAGSLPDGTTLFTGSYRWSNEAGNAISNRVGRVLPNGARDLSWTEPQLNDYADSLLVEPSGSVVIGGDFTTINGVSRQGLARILPAVPYDPIYDNGFE